MRVHHEMGTYRRIGGFVALWWMAALSPVWAAEVTVTGTETPATAPVDAAPGMDELKADLLQALIENGLPTGTSKAELVPWALALLAALALAFAGWKFGKDNPYVVFATDAKNAVHQAYIEHIQPAKDEDRKLSGEQKRNFAFEILKKQAKGATAKIIKEKGKRWVMGQLHGIANKLMGKNK